jgi:hypothetical protein
VEQTNSMKYHNLLILVVCLAYTCVGRAEDRREGLQKHWNRIHDLSNHQLHQRKILLSNSIIDTTVEVHVRNHEKRGLLEMEEEKRQFLVQVEGGKMNRKMLEERIKEVVWKEDVHVERYIPHHSFLVMCSYGASLLISEIPKVCFSFLTFLLFLYCVHFISFVLFLYIVFISFHFFCFITVFSFFLFFCYYIVFFSFIFNVYLFFLIGAVGWRI